MSFTPTRAGALLAAIALSALSGCATLTDSNQQEILVRAILDHREVAGVGCVLSNQAGRWFVTAPGRVTVRKSFGDLQVDCSKQGVGAAREAVASRFGTANLMGNAVSSAGLGYFVDRHSGAGFDYPIALTVLMRPAPGAGDAAPSAGAASVMY